MVPRFSVLDPRYFAPERVLTDDEFSGVRWLLREVTKRGCLLIDDRRLLVRELLCAAKACRAAPPPHDERKALLAEQTARLLTTDATCVLETAVPAEVASVPETLTALSRVKVVDAVFLAEPPPLLAQSYPVTRSHESPAYAADDRVRLDTNGDGGFDAAADPRVRAMLKRVLFHSRSLRMIDRYLFQTNSITRSETALRNITYEWERGCFKSPVTLDLFTVCEQAKKDDPPQSPAQRLRQCRESIDRVLRKLGWHNIRIRVKVLEPREAPHDRFLIGDRGCLELSAGIDRLGWVARDGFSMSFDRSYPREARKLERLGLDEEWSIE
jgi:hypothetical protein